MAEIMTVTGAQLGARSFHINTVTYTEPCDIELYCGWYNVNPEKITGMTLDVGDFGDRNIFLTESPCPLSVNAIWHNLEYYK